MARDAMDLREHAHGQDAPPITWGASIVLASLMIVSGIAMAVIGLGSGGPSGPSNDAPDHRLHLLLSSTIDLVAGADNASYEDLPVSSLLFLMLIDGVDGDDNLTEEVRSRAMFLYPGSDGMVMRASAEGFPELTVFGSEVPGAPVFLEARVISGGLSIYVVLTIWGYGE